MIAKEKYTPRCWYSTELNKDAVHGCAPVEQFEGILYVLGFWGTKGYVCYLKAIYKSVSVILADFGTVVDH